MSALAAEKADLRAAVLAARDRLDAQWRGQASEAITTTLRQLPQQRAAQALLSYAAFRSEFDTRAFNEHVLASGRTLLLPRVDRAIRRLRLYFVTSLTEDVVPGVWGILEPNPARCREATIDDVDFALIPGVAFDARGGRLGYGGGFYDRLLAGARSGLAKVAAAFSAQVVDAVPVGELDSRVDTLVTELGTTSTR